MAAKPSEPSANAPPNGNMRWSTVWRAMGVPRTTGTGFLRMAQTQGHQRQGGGGQADRGSPWIWLSRTPIGAPAAMPP